MFVLIYDIYLSMPSINFFIFNRGLNFSSNLTKYEKLLDQDKLGVLLVPKITMVSGEAKGWLTRAAARVSFLKKIIINYNL